MSAPGEIVLEARGLACRREATFICADALAFSVGSFSVLAGEAQSGHELLLRVLGLLERPDTGELLIEGVPVQDLNEEKRLHLRDRRLGFVFTAPFLLPAFSVIENVAMPLFKVSEANAAEARRRGETLLNFIDLLDFAGTPAADLSPADQRRVSLARALVNAPAALLIEGIDAGLPSDEVHAFVALAREAAARFNVAVIATGSRQFSAELADRVVEIRDHAVQASSPLLPRPPA